MSEFQEYQEMETPRQGWVSVDGKVYGTADPEMLQSAKTMQERKHVNVDNCMTPYLKTIWKM